MAVLGGYIYYNTNVLNEYRTSDDEERWAADYEKTLIGFETRAAAADHGRHARRRRSTRTTRGWSRRVSYMVENRTGAPLDRGPHVAGRARSR